MKKLIARAVCATLVAGVFSLDASAGNPVQLDDSRGLSLTNSPTAFVYSTLIEDGAPANSFVAEIETEGFLFCNYFDASSGSVETHEKFRLRPVHGGWIFPSDSGVNLSVPGVRSLDYAHQTLQIDTCGLLDDSSVNYPGSAGCGGSAMQCFVADTTGKGVSDTRYFFHDGFDARQPTSVESWVDIVDLSYPTLSAPYLEFTIVVHEPSGGSAGQPNGFSVASDTYVLRKGFDQTMFTDCEMPGADPYRRRCWLADTSLGAWNALPDDQPVASVVLFTGPTVSEHDYSDNVAFAYPVPQQ